MAISALAVTTAKSHAHQRFLDKPSSSYDPTSSSTCSFSSKPKNNAKMLCLAASNFVSKKGVLDVGIGLLAASVLSLTPLDANATRIEYYATVADPPCELNFVPSGLGYCDVTPGTGEKAPYSELINVRFQLQYLFIIIIVIAAFCFSFSVPCICVLWHNCKRLLVLSFLVGYGLWWSGGCGVFAWKENPQECQEELQHK